MKLPFYLQAFLILLGVSAVTLWLTWSVQVGGSIIAYTSGGTPIFVFILSSGIAGLSMIPTWIAKERKSNEIAMRIGVISSVILSIFVGIPIGTIVQL